MNPSQRKEAFVQLGEFFSSIVHNTEFESERLGELANKFKHFASSVYKHNPWFTENFVYQSINLLAEMLKEEKLESWLSAYSEFNQPVKPKIIGVVIAGNIPLVGFHDFLCVLLSGNIFLGKLSSKDNEMLKVAAEVLVEIEPEFKGKIVFTEGKLEGFDAVIATGSNNTARYFEYYFGKYPHIIRKNRNSVAILTGNESDEELKLLSDDIFMYYGLGCRSVSKLFVPLGYNFTRFFEISEHYSYLRNHNKFANNYEYNKSIWLMNSIPHFDNGFVLLRKENALASPIGTLYYDEYTELSEVSKRLESDKEQIQCIVMAGDQIGCTRPGKSQSPDVWNYSDDVDTLKFLLNL